jgi:hypothetical protein
MGDWFHRTIVESGRLPLFCFFVAVIVTFGFIRASVRMIRAGVRWWPGNVEPGGLHVHHAVFGVVFMVLGGLAGLSLPDRARVGLCVVSVVFGVGTALVLDEFALILHLRDVYWSTDGRTSIDAVFAALAITGLLLLGLRPDVQLSKVTDENGHPDLLASILTSTVAVLLVAGLAGTTLLKGKIWTGLLGVFIPIFMLVGAVRLGRPNSPWARWRYRPDRRRGAHKMATARRREARYREPLIRLKIRLQDLVGGRPG